METKKLKIITCCEDQPRFLWEVDTLLSNFKEFEYDKITDVLVFYKSVLKDEWKLLQEKYPESSFYFYKDDGIANVGKNVNYPPVIRPWMMHKHFSDNPSLSKEVIFYVDTDILFLKKLNFTPFLKDNINYLSWTGSADRTSNYIWDKYFLSKEKDVLPHKLKDYSKINVLDGVAQICNITKEKIIENSLNTGGAQYLLKDISPEFWTKVLERCITIRIYLSSIINKEFFKNEDSGFQGWCADMWAVLYTLWEEGKQTQCPKELDFSWSTDLINNDNYILHNAGVTADSKLRTRVEDENGEKIEVECPAFYKGNYFYSSPDKSTLENIINNPISNTYFTSMYAKQILKTLYNG